MYSLYDTLAGGLPHSEICGSKFAHNSPQLIAACHVLHRLCMPRHPPNALKTLDSHVINQVISSYPQTPGGHIRDLGFRRISADGQIHKKVNGGLASP